MDVAANGGANGDIGPYDSCPIIGRLTLDIGNQSPGYWATCCCSHGFHVDYDVETRHLLIERLYYIYFFNCTYNYN